MRRTPAAALAGVVTVAAIASGLLVATADAALQCPPPTRPGQVVVAGKRIQTCLGGVVEVPPHCDPGPCDPTALAPQE